ncbi:MAG TPA: hypothetical protein PKD64_18290 [Pirellulaceae bacterium]|nr:hypothetical protein [Pirellulaceae bacterium]HMO94139.1 hypothetical protein [Pirellulaceae bacterium]HMP71210.1 hypothetical protein [Pirellulaceae bacterium]
MIEYRLAQGLQMGIAERLEICGIGVIASAIRTARLLEEFRPRQVVLLGIAGTYDANRVLGDVIQANQVSIDGIGAGEGSDFKSLGDINLSPLPTHISTIDDTIELEISGDVHLLTVCNAAASLRQVENRLRRFPTASVEDMEGYAVALACKLAETKLIIIRGISNLAGVRDFSQWKIDLAMEQCVKRVNQLLKETRDA